MAIYHASAQVISRSKGQSSIASASYRSGQKLDDDFYGKSYDYTSKQEIDKIEAMIIAPKDAPNWVYNRESLWNTVEFTEKRRDAQLAREFNFALPHEISKQQQINLVIKFVKENFATLGMVADICFHIKTGNNHVHVMLTMRKLLRSGFGNKVREWNQKAKLIEWRSNWSKTVNSFLEKNNISDRIDHRSYKDQGLDLRSTKHMGYKVSKLEKLGIETEIGTKNREIREYNKNIIELKKYQKLRNELVEKKWKDKLIEKIDISLETATSKIEFMKIMNSYGYDVKWVDYHKHMSYTIPELKVNCRDRRLPERYSKSNLEKHFKKLERVNNVDYKLLYKQQLYKIEDIKNKKEYLLKKINNLEKSIISKLINKKELEYHKLEYQKVSTDFEKEKINLLEYKKLNENKESKNENKKNKVDKLIEEMKNRNQQNINTNHKNKNKVDELIEEKRKQLKSDKNNDKGKNKNPKR